jgi:hypothetical protein
MKMIDMQEIAVDKTVFRGGVFSNANAPALRFHGEGGPISLENREKKF